MKAVIMAGGKGSRIASLFPDVPKPMIEMVGKPILERQIDVLTGQGITDITIITGYKKERIKSYFGQRVKYIDEDEPLGTAGALYYLRDVVDDDFLLVNGDIIFDVDISRMIKAHRQSGAAATIAVHPNVHPFDSGVVDCDADGFVTNWYTKEGVRPKWYKNLTNAGIHVLSPRVLQKIAAPVKTDLDRDIFPGFIASRELFAYHTSEYIHDVGTPERLIQTENDIKSGLVSARSLKNKQRTIFIDRDGTINEYVSFLKDIEDFRLIDGVSDVIRRINRSRYLAICVTNQPVIARGELTFAGVRDIHNKRETLLGLDGAYLDDIFFCPHHPDGGFPGEIPELKCKCHCRKPDIGMFTIAAERYNIDLSQSYMVGDSESDKKAAENAGCKGYFDSLKALAENVEEIYET
jgi:D-glycero-D-manno-heptose 1,7-bisphosphate phosphatase